MFIAIWEYTVPREHEQAFEHLYNQQGDWVKLFKNSPEYLETQLFKKTDRTYLTIDKWKSKAAYDAFYKANSKEIDRIDELGDGLTSHEARIGDYELL